MLGGLLVVLWFFIFAVINYFLCKLLKIKTTLLRNIFSWTFLMVFIIMVELILLVYYKYVHEKSEEYYRTNTCYWTENVNVVDMFSYKLYMDLYADYSLADKRYGKIIENVGCRFVISGEEAHAFFCMLFVPIILYYFVFFDEIKIYLFSLMLSVSQFSIIVWYLSTVCIELYFVENKQFWFPPLLWNVPWVILPIYIVYSVFCQLISLKN